MTNREPHSPIFSTDGSISGIPVRQDNTQSQSPPDTTSSCTTMGMSPYMITNQTQQYLNGVQQVPMGAPYGVQSPVMTAEQMQQYQKIDQELYKKEREKDLRIQEYSEKADIKVRENISAKWVEREHQKELMGSKATYHEYLKTIGYDFQIDMFKRLVVSYVDAAGNFLFTVPFLNVYDYHTRLLTSYCPEQISVLKVCWNMDGKENSFFWRHKDNESSTRFIRCLIDKGAKSLVSKRMTNELSDALLAYSYSSADEEEIAYSKGWNKYDDGSWHYIYDNDDEITMMEVLQNV